jgi:hypothetical protein
MTRAVQERSRMQGKFHVRFGSEGGVSRRRVVVATQRFSLTALLQRLGKRDQ